MKELIEAVRQMRYCQQEHERTKNYASLHNMKNAERQVDKLLAEMPQVVNNTQKS